MLLKLASGASKIVDLVADIVVVGLLSFLKGSFEWIRIPGSGVHSQV